MGLLLLVGWNRRLIYTVTAFTLGHSVTLAMVTLGLFDYPVSLVEFMIALSIYVLAVELARGSAGALWRQPWWLAGGFGLLHGMGFAGALAETGLPQSNVPLALLFFNVGIELGQLAFIALLVLVAALGGRLIGERVAAHPERNTAYSGESSDHEEGIRGEGATARLTAIAGSEAQHLGGVS